jgi:CRISPR/Cas system type I-B associated protein Csh2 (Cas7 group RAMP superfamily)
MNESDKGSPEMDVELQAHIGRHLKASYDDILVQNVPDRFLDLLKSLEAREKSQGEKADRS